MNKKISIILFVALAAAVSFSEDNLKIGIRAGANLNHFSYGTKDKDNPGVGYGGSVGIVANILLTRFLSYNPELNFLYRALYWYDNRQGYGSPACPGPPSPNPNICDYKYMETEFAISIPLMFQILPIEKVPLHFALGAQFDIPILPTEWRFAYQDPVKLDLEHSRAMFDFGFVLGLGYNITKSFAIDLRCVMGLTSFTGKKDDKSSFNQYGIGLNYLL